MDQGGSMESKLRLSLPMKMPDLRRHILELERELNAVGSANRRAGLTSAQALILRLLSERGGEMSVADLNDELKLDKSTVSQSLAQIQKNGWLKIMENPEDRRFKSVVLTPDGEQRVRMFCFELDDILFQVLEGANQDQKNTILAGIAYLQHFMKNKRIAKESALEPKETQHEIHI
jgi:MarR family transcriptional regulator, transcriptional regulator for hemolysin